MRTGSGSLSHSLIRTIRPTGHLHTFDFHENRVNLARDEFKVHGISEFVTVQQRDVCAEGFGDELKHKADAIFLDLPHPWLTIDSAVNTLKESGGKLCSFSPCIEQVQRTCEKLTSHGFVEIKTYENLQTEYQVHYKSIPILDLESLMKDEETNGAEPPKKKGKFKIKQDENKILTVSEPRTTPGHTGYITIATLPPEFARNVFDS
ncbi:tRNA (adenine(58)-N(1))-methyltransferase catalytic subunit TRMT61A-like [Belonocnema kinseyi]|uniref:tRNA (adenine(58)-N(1))-methyltransferase catalytic subunit TRMT61A-like n=1 Tax=Belonocnema kinseyi TaxID=2817044 RepID=UPI00143D3774|nr:tRNA (adenine(58)-N(1))-methyltransferase catalytic subunit TRMT61A-like [Belonocnema kinseyi]